MFENKYPYTDFHELNLDWFLAEFKKVHNHVDDLDATVHQFTEFVTNYFENLDVQEEINKKLDAMAADGSLSALIQPLFDEYKTEINGIVNGQNTRLTEVEGDMITLSNRMDSFVHLAEGSTTGDAELIDARVGANGITYNTAGDAIRGQYEDAIDHVDNVYLQIGEFYQDWLQNTTIIDGKYINYHDGTEVLNASLSATDFIPVMKNTEVITYKELQLAFYDENKTYVSGLLLNANGNCYFHVPNDDTIRYMRLCYTTTDLPDCYIYYKKSSYDAKLEEDYMPRKELNPLLNINPENMIDTNALFEGKYVNFANGTLAGLATYSATDYIAAYPGFTYRCAGNDGGTMVAFYDKDYTYISGLNLAYNTTFQAPDNAAVRWMRWSSLTANSASFSISVAGNNEKIKYITTSEGILEGLEDAYAHGYKKVVVQSGTYDLIQEYTDKYGADYFNDYTTNYNNLANGYNDRGVWLENIEITFAQNAFVTMKYTGNNANVKTFLSAFAIGANVILRGLQLDSAGLRYGIHPDFNPATYSYFRMYDCDLVHDDGTSGTNQVIGAGLGNCCDWSFENCIFRSDEE